MKIMVLYAKAGGGHESAAKAIALTIQNLYPVNRVEIVDIFGDSPLWIQNVISKGYVVLTEKLPFLWWILNHTIWRHRLLINVCFRLAIPWNTINQKMTVFKPDLVVSTYFNLGKEISKISQKQGKNIKYISVAPDIFTPSEPWFADISSQLVVFSQQAWEIAIKNGVHPQNVKQLGYFFNEQFNQKLPETQLKVFKKRIGLKSSFKTVLLVGGGESMPNGERNTQGNAEE